MSDFDMSTPSIDETVRRRFEQAWIENRPEPVDRFLPERNDPRYVATLEELVHIELEFAWKVWLQTSCGQDGRVTDETIARPTGVEDFLGRFDCLRDPEIAGRLVQQECLVRRENGEAVDVEEFRRRFPELVIHGGTLESALQTIVSRPTAAQRASADTEVEQLPRQFGHYELLDELGRGGMGIVYRARQISADRIVALKVIRRDRIAALPRDTRTTPLDRFRHEAQAAAQLEHDNIVSVYEVGDVDGEPFFSMRYVEGCSLTDLLRDGPLEGRRAAGYLAPVARAIDMAHRHGILHRDLKPQNMLVDRQTDRAMVADFGLAKLIETDVELTISGEVMGSPPYMSPEQARDSAHVTIQSDIYALGATLYHLLIGRPPFQAATPLETLRQVTDVQPAPLRQIDPSIDRDLETICLKCLDKEPQRRYATAAALAEDLEHYLAGEPIVARPVGALERTWRWCRRNPLVASLLGSTVLFLVLALAASLIGYVQTSAALSTAERRYGELKQVVDKFYTRISEDKLLNQPGMQPLQQELLKAALPHYQQFLSERADDPAIRDELAMAHFRVGEITEKIDSPEAALPSYKAACDMQRQLVAERPDDQDRLCALGDTLTAMGSALHRQGKLGEARKRHQEAIDVRRRLVEAAPRDNESRRMLANAYMNAGLAERELGSAEKAREQFDRAQTLRHEILRDAPDSPKTRRDLAKGHFGLAVLALSLLEPDLPAARKDLHSAVDLFEDLLQSEPGDLDNQYRLFLCYRLLADIECVAEDWTEALRLYAEALGRLETLASRNPAVPRYQAELASFHMNLAMLRRDLERPDEAAAALQQAATILQRLLEQSPDVPKYRRDLAVTLRELATVESDPNEARAHLKASADHLRQLVEVSPENEEFKEQLQRTEDAISRREQ